MTYTKVYGASEPEDIQLLDDAGVLIGTGLTLGISWEGTAPSPAPTVAWLSAAAGTVRMTGLESVPRGVYRFRFTLTDGLSKVGHCPNGMATDSLHVV